MRERELETNTYKYIDAYLHINEALERQIHDVNLIKSAIKQSIERTEASEDGDAYLRILKIFDRIAMIFMYSHEKMQMEMSTQERDRVIEELQLLYVLIRLLNPSGHQLQHVTSENAGIVNMWQKAVVTHCLVSRVRNLPTIEPLPPTDALRDAFEKHAWQDSIPGEG